MAGQPDAQPRDPVVAAIEHVLTAEREGVEALRKSRAEAERLLTETRARAAALARRVDHCISKLHTAYLQKIEREIGALEQVQAANAVGTGEPFDQAALTEAARRVAARLTGGA